MGEEHLYSIKSTFPVRGVILEGQYHFFVFLPVPRVALPANFLGFSRWSRKLILNFQFLIPIPEKSHPEATSVFDRK